MAYSFSSIIPEFFPTCEIQAQIPIFKDAGHTDSIFKIQK